MEKVTGLPGQTDDEGVLIANVPDIGIPVHALLGNEMLLVTVHVSPILLGFLPTTTSRIVWFAPLVTTL